MPTGYTAAIGDKEDYRFREFALHCARNFGACIMQRDDPSSELPDPDEKPSNYHAEAFDKAHADLALFRSMSIEEAVLAQREEMNWFRSHMKESQQKSAELRKRYEAMLVHVEAWQPPTTDHQGMKAFMRQQITESIKWDCHDGSYYRDEIAALDIPTEKWLRAKITKARSDMAHHAEEHAKEEARVEGRNQWKRQLIASLP